MSAMFDKKQSETSDHFKAFGMTQALFEGFAGWKDIWLDMITWSNAVNGYFEEKDKSYYIKDVKNVSIVGPSYLIFGKDVFSVYIYHLNMA